MPNEDRFKTIESRLDAATGEWARRSEVRDGELAELREALADLAARLAGVEKEADRSPSWLALLATAATAAGLVGGLARFGLTSTTEPIKEAQVEIREQFGKLEDRQDNVRSRLSRLEGVLNEIDKKVEDIDKLGSRKWVQRQEK